VRCGLGRAPLRGTCGSVLSALPVATESLVFGKVGDSATRVISPRSFTAGEHDASPLHFNLSIDIAPLLKLYLKYHTNADAVQRILDAKQI